MKILFAFIFFSSMAFGQTKILGAGATFPYPLYSKMFQEYQKKAAGVQFNYQPIGSGGGVKQLSMNLVDFGASDVRLTDAEKELFKSEVLEVPMTIGGIVLAYKLQGVKELRLSREALSAIFTGKAQKWNDELIQKNNPGMKLPDMPIKVVTRADASGTTAVFTEYLGMISVDFKSQVGVGKAVMWPMMGAKGKGNDGVTALIKATEGSIGYIEMAYAVNQKLPVASLENKKGVYITPTLAGFTKSAEVAKLGSYQILDSDNSQAYPISSFTFVLLQKVARDEKVNVLVKQFLKWALVDGQKLASPLHYSSLPVSLTNELVKKVESF